MKTKSRFTFCFIILHSSFILSTHAQGTAFTYQGRLNDGTGLANGTYHLRFALFDALTVGNQVGSPVTNSPVNVSNGLFTVTLDFGANFPGADRWLEIGVRTNGGGAFTTLIPRQPITATPYAITAGNLSGALPGASLSGTYSSPVTLNNVANNFAGSGANLTALNASQLTSGTVPDARLSANVSLLGASIESAEITDGTVTPADLNLTAFNPTFWRTAGNAGTTPGAQFVGTTDNQPLELRVNGNRALRLQPSSSPSLIGGSASNVVTGLGGVIGGGGSVSQPNFVAGKFATVAGGSGNLAGDESYGPADNAFVGGGNRNASLAHYCAIVGGRFNTNVGINSVVGAGYQNLIQQNSSVIGGGSVNAILYGPGVALTLGDGQVIGGGTSNSIASDSPNAVIVGGTGNAIQQLGNAPADAAFIGAGRYNTNRAEFAFVGAGEGNLVETNAAHSAILAGFHNLIDQTAVDSAIVGGEHNLIIVTNDYLTDGFIGGGFQNTLASSVAVIGGGTHNLIDHDADGSVIPGGAGNTVSPQAKYAVLAGGAGNVIDHDGKWNSIGGGQGNGTGPFSFWNVIGGGYNNTNSGSYATVPGGSHNFAGAGHAFAAGYRARALHPGAFVWADTTDADFSSTTNDVFLIRANHGVAINTNDPAGAALNVAGPVRASVFEGSGSGLIVPAANLSGVVSFLNLPGGFAMLDSGSGQTFTGQNTFAAPVNIYDATTTEPDDGTLHIGGQGANGSPKLVKFGDADFCYLGENGADDRMELRAGQFYFNNGAVGIGTNAPQQKLHVIGNILASGTITPNSDRNAKTDFATVDAGSVLERVARLPIQQWRFKSEPDGVKHVGPMAQDFRAVFGLGEIPTAIATVDADGVALAAIQGLNQKVEEQRAENAELKRELSEIKQLLLKLSDKKD